MTDTLTPPPTRQFMRCENGHLLEFGNLTFRSEQKSWFRCVECHNMQNKKARAKRRYKFKAKAGGPSRNGRSTSSISYLMDCAIFELMYAPDEPEQHEEIVSNYSMRIARARIQNLNATARKSAPLEEYVRRAREEILARAEAEYMAKDESKKPWKYLQIKPEARAAWDRFDSALEKARNTGEGVPNCDGKPELYSDYPEDAMPTGDEAFDLCYGCPLMEMCATFAELERPAYGVWAADRWLAGDTVNDD